MTKNDTVQTKRRLQSQMWTVYSAVVVLMWLMTVDLKPGQQLKSDVALTVGQLHVQMQKFLAT